MFFTISTESKYITTQPLHRHCEPLNQARNINLLRGEAISLQNLTPSQKDNINLAKQLNANTMNKGGCVYIITNKNFTVLYTGVTSDLILRIQQHKEKFYPDSFTAKYNCFILVYYKFFPSIEEAIFEEKRIKAGNRAKKIKLIEGVNPDWNDLWEEIKQW